MPNRPNTITILEAHERDDGALELWADMGGHEVSFMLPRGVWENRALNYGLARVRTEHDLDGGPSEQFFEPLVDDATMVDGVLGVLFEEILDNLEDSNYDWGKDTPPLRPTPQSRPDLTPRPDLVGYAQRVRRRAPERLTEPRTLLIERKKGVEVRRSERANGKEL